MKKTKSATTEVQGMAMDGYANLLESNSALAGSLRGINQQAVREYTPIVETIRHYLYQDIDGLALDALANTNVETIS